MTQVPHGPAPTPLAWPPSPLPLLHRLGEAADAPADAGARVRPSDKGSSPFSRSQSPSGAAPDLAARIPRRVPRASPRALRRTAIARRVPSSPSAMKKAICTHLGGGGGGRSPLEDQTHAGRGTQKDLRAQTTVTDYCYLDAAKCRNPARPRSTALSGPRGLTCTPSACCSPGRGRHRRGKCSPASPSAWRGR